MSLVVTVLHVMVCVFLIVVVLLQRGKGAEIGAVFGGGASSTVFGSRGAGSFLTKLTTGAAVVFMATSLILAILGHERASESLLDGATPSAPAPAPAATPSPFAEPPAAPGAPGAAAPTTPAAPGAPAAPKAEAAPATPPAAAPPKAEPDAAAPAAKKP